MMDAFIKNIDNAVRTIFSTQRASSRPYPGENLPETSLAHKQRRHTAGLMRVNHAGEVCAQALYQGQGMTAQLTDVRDKMQQAAIEENDHLAWCEQRLQELHGHTSHLNAIWYGGAFFIGAIAGLIGDKWSLGFVAETEKQVVAHLQKHLDQLPKQDEKSRAVLQQMQKDEEHHATIAITAGAHDLPVSIKKIMHWSAKVMTKTAYWL